MKINQNQLEFLGDLIANISLKDTLGCDGCSELLDQFADVMLSETPLPPDLLAVQAHIEQCRCCRYEYQLLLEALREIENEI